MDQKRLFLAIAVSLAILLGFQMLIAPHLPKPPPRPVAELTAPADVTPAPTAGSAVPAAGAAPAATSGAVPSKVPRVKIAAPRVAGSISLLGARLDDLLLTQYRETIEPDSPDVRLLEPRSDKDPYYIQYRLDRTARQQRGEIAG